MKSSSETKRTLKTNQRCDDPIRKKNEDKPETILSKWCRGVCEQQSAEAARGGDETQAAGE